MNPTASSLEDVKLTYRFIVLGLVSFIFFLFLYFINLDVLQTGVYRVNSIWVLAHLFILGFLIMTVMGVMYQLIPVALLVPIYSNKLSHLHFWVYVIGVVGLIYGLWNMDTGSMFLFGTLAFTGVLLFVANVFLSVRSIKKWNMMSRIIVSAVFYFFMNVLFGFLLVMNYQYGLWPAFHNDILYSHILFGLVGWLTTVIMGFSYKMAPMFALSHGYTEAYAKWILLGTHTAILTVVTGLFTDIDILNWIGLLLFVLIYLLFTLQVKAIMQKKLKSKLDIGFKTAIYSIYFTAALLVLSPFGFVLWGEAFVFPFVYLFIMSWIGLSVMGYLFKVVPFLWWTDKYSERVGKEKVPMLADMVDENKGKWSFEMMFIGMLGNAIGIGLHLQTMMLISSVIFIIGGLLYSYLVLRTFKM